MPMSFILIYLPYGILINFRPKLKKIRADVRGLEPFTCANYATRNGVLTWQVVKLTGQEVMKYSSYKKLLNM